MKKTNTQADGDLTLLLDSSGFGARVGTRFLSEAARAENNGKLLVVRGVPATVLNEKNLNNRTYPEAIFRGVIEACRANGKFDNRSLLGASDGHPTESNYVEPINASHVVVGADIRNVGGRSILFNDWMVLETDNGRNLRSLIESGVTFGTSLRGLGNISEAGVVSDYEYLSTDAVGHPSAGTYAEMYEANIDYVSKKRGIGEKADSGSFGAILDGDPTSNGGGEEADMADERVSVSKDDLAEVKETVKSLKKENSALREEVTKQEEAAESAAEAKTGEETAKDERIEAIRRRMAEGAERRAADRGRSRRRMGLREGEDRLESERWMEGRRSRRRALRRGPGRDREDRRDERIVEELTAKCESLARENAELERNCERLLAFAKPLKEEYALLERGAAKLLAERQAKTGRGVRAGRPGGERGRRPAAGTSTRRLREMLTELYEAYNNLEGKEFRTQVRGRRETRMSDGLADSLERRYAGAIRLNESLVHLIGKLKARLDESHGMKEMSRTYQAQAAKRISPKRESGHRRPSGLTY